MKNLTPVLVTFLISLSWAKIDENRDVQLAKFMKNFRTTFEDSVINLSLPEDAFLNISAFLSKYGYPFESHPIITEDGFILEIHRIPSKNNNSSVVLLVPPLLASSIDYVNQGPNVSLALLLYDQGYDVWIMNPRGTRWSMNHQTLNSSEKAFWDFSFHEKGIYDVSASIDFTLNNTGVANLTLVGFSEGTSASMALLSTRPEYNDMVEVVVLLSPIGYMGGVQSPIPLFLVKYMSEIESFMDNLHFYGLPYIESVSQLLIKICTIDGFDEICSGVIGLVMGYDPDELDTDFMLVLLSDKPAGFSMKQLLHYGQEISTASFRQYDYGTSGNKEHYGTSEPPTYDPKKITAQVAVYYGKNDYFAAISDVEKLLNQLPTVVDAYLIEYEYFNHLDFVAAKDVKTMLYDRVLSVIKKYTS
ncbi:lipase 3-like [Euwallacea similis]|uniref:lipase 3-like n=1 Tax=Euwallacea similis TaxID=1736056 RepID=UPI00344B8769